MKDKPVKRMFKKRRSMLVMLVAMIFAILIISMGIAGVVSFFMLSRSIIPSLPENRHILIIVYMVLVSVFIGTILARFSGRRFLRRIYELVNATKEVAAGNFNIRLECGGAREIDRIARSFNEMVSELSAIETLRSDFVSNISHEYKTPISSIRGFARRLKKDTLTDEQRNEYLDIIISESERLTRLSSNVLLLSRLESTEKLSEKAEYSLDEQIRRTILLLDPQFQKKELEVEAALDSVLIVANDEMLNHLWLNLLENAIKFSHNGGTIKITLGTTLDAVVVTISDEGVGMDDNVKKRIFDKFYQGDQSRATEGNGLGLSLVKRILELENGKIVITSELHKGTCFTVSLPFRKTEALPKR